ncbi:MAG: hypothetical protein DRP54_06640 [Spirochaetes bacterium]|nr:MAG: hypothetical protein DRP54_06640 [Spirochaetota bacterium]
MSKGMKIGDFAIFVISIIVVALLFVNNYIAKPRGKVVEIVTVNGSLSYSLDDNRVVRAAGPLGYTIIRIENGEVWVEASPCPEKICIKTGKISRVGQQVVCLPNRVFIEINGGISEVDAVSR